MPRTNNPLNLVSGGGSVSPGSVSQSALSPSEVGAVSGSLGAHVDDPSGAHPASAISILDPFDSYMLGHNAQGGFNALAALIPPSMGGVGSDGVAWLGSSNTGVPDWGILKLHDGVVTFTGNTGADPHAVYPYYYRAPVAPSGVGLLGTGMEDDTDPTFNVFDGGFPAYTGGGQGLTHAAFTTVATVGYPSWRVLSAIPNPAVVVSGIVSPADRGVLALVRWPTGSNPTPPAPAANVADVQSRCIAAILLGKGAENNGCDGTPGNLFMESSGSLSASGSFNFLDNLVVGDTVTIDLSVLPGGPAAPTVFTAVAGIPASPLEFQTGTGAGATGDNFALAVNTLYLPGFLAAFSNGAGVVDVRVEVQGAVGNTVGFSSTASVLDLVVTPPTGGADVTPSPFNFPGRAAGQFNLNEIHTGLGLGTVAPPFNPAKGQVRLLTDPAAASFSPSTVAGGIPILGATTAAIGTTTPVAWLPYSLGGGTDGNFFAYRLPYLKDYSATSGIVYTAASERARFTTTAGVGPALTPTLTQAGDYDDFTVNFWPFQLGRYRHRFELQVPPLPAATRLDDNYAVVHFKKEVDFEAYVRDAIVPGDGQVYSVNLMEWVGTASPYDLLLNLVTSTPSSSPASLVNRAEILEDDTGTVLPAAGGVSNYTLDTTTVGATTFYSGVEYLVPVDPTTAAAPSIAITGLAFDYVNLFNASYRSHDTVPVGGPLAGDNRKYAVNQNPAFLSMSSYSYEGSESPVVTTVATGTALFPASLGQIRRQRIEFGYADLTNPVTANPGTADHALYSFAPAPGLSNGIYFTGDTSTPSFTRDARIRLVFRRPLIVDGSGFSIPSVFNLPRDTGVTVLYHSMKEGTATVTVPYGNPSNLARMGYSTTKDQDERFLDEVYRYPEDWTPLPGPLAAQLQGPGLPTGPVAIQVPVRPGTPPYTGWMTLLLHTSALDNATTNLDNALQVAGLPARDPSYAEGLAAPFPSSGVLVYPKEDYSVGYDPAGPDYSVLTGDRVYVRAFDAGAANVGATTVTLRLWGVEVANFQYVGPGPGGVGMAVMVKVPGLTTWMDAGRADGAGPSKQDIALDGAGCLSGAVTGTDLSTQIRYTDVTVNLGPAALFLNAEVPQRCPVLVKVILKDNATGKALDWANVAATAATSTCRGLVGITLQ
jgi:hypothetical protein